ncbi:MAG: hypothetical protein L0I76_08910 [Pseudonocardia sp.]|nr:hypothetical protein [Pseudonocardia sp.]
MTTAHARTTRVMWWFGAASVAISAGAAVQLLVGAARTEDFFAWTIAVPASAGFIGLFYLASVVMGVLALRQPWWAPARTALVPVVLFVALVLAVTLLHLSAFHLFAGGPLARSAAWVWLAVYIVTPLGYVFAFRWQDRAPGGDPPRREPLPPGTRVTLAAATGLLGVLGVALLVAPRPIAALWPWALTALTGRMAGATLLGVGLLAFSVVRVDDRPTGRIAATGLGVAGGTAALVPLVYGRGAVDWTGPSVWLYTVVAVVLLVAALAVVLPGDRVREGGG